MQFSGLFQMNRRFNLSVFTWPLLQEELYNTAVREHRSTLYKGTAAVKSRVPWEISHHFLSRTVKGRSLLIQLSSQLNVPVGNFPSLPDNSNVLDLLSLSVQVTMVIRTNQEKECASWYLQGGDDDFYSLSKSKRKKQVDLSFYLSQGSCEMSAVVLQWYWMHCLVYILPLEGDT